MKLTKLFAAAVAATTLWIVPASATTIAATGTTDVTVDPGFLGILSAGEITASEIGGATVDTTSGVVFSFAITGGDLDLLQIDHSGGVLFSNSLGSISASNFFIDGIAGTVAADVSIDDGSTVTDLFDLAIFDLANAVVGPTITADLIPNATLLGAFGGTFFEEVPELPEYIVFGSASTSPQPVPLPAAGWLLLAGIGGLAALRRRKATA